jgi:hypothetical protein
MISMKIKLILCGILLLAIVGGCKPAASVPPYTSNNTTTTGACGISPCPIMTDAPYSISVQEARDFLGTTTFFIDVRSQAKYDAGHLEGAVAIPIDELETRLAEVLKDKRIIVYSACF